MFQVPVSQASIDQNRFDFQMPGDEKTYSIPKLKFLRPGFVRTLKGMTEQDVIFAILDEFGLDLVDKFESIDQVVALYTAWAEASGIDLGESLGSSNSSKTTEEPSTETSSSSAVPSTTSEPQPSPGSISSSTYGGAVPTAPSTGASTE